MKPTLQLKLTPNLTLTPQLQQSIRLLQLSTHELNQEIERMAQENPLLELENSIHEQPYADDTPSENQLSSTLSNEESIQSEDSYLNNNELLPSNSSEVEPEWYGDQDSPYTKRNDDEDEWDLFQQTAESISLREHLATQVSLSQIDDRERKIVGLLIDSLDDAGYLSQDLVELLELIPSELDIQLQDLEAALTHLQRLDPPGIGARNLRECLTLQLQSLSETTPFRDKALQLVTTDLECLAAKDFRQIKKMLQCDDHCLRAIQQLITHLNPRPGEAYKNDFARYIVPDVIAVKSEETWIAKLNPGSLPRLSINHLYANILKQNKNESTQSLIGQLNEAKWLIKNIQQRSDTILRVSNEIVARQQDFFENGAVSMRPLIMREISESLELHESTVSRVTTQKFIHTPHGIFELKYFFSSHVSTDTGDTCSAVAIRTLIKQLIEVENQKKPLSDLQISKMLGEKGIVVARRTVAKYRELLHIPPANLRKIV